MSQAELTTSVQVNTASTDEGVFSPETRAQALRVLTKQHGGLVAAMGAPMRNLVDWLIARDASTYDAARIIEARRRFNEAANDATFIPEEEKKVA